MIFDTIKSAYKFCKTENFEKVFVIGGGQIFKKTIADADEMIISHMDFNAQGDVYFPEINLKKWKVSLRDKKNGFEIVTYKKKNRDK